MLKTNGSSNTTQSNCCDYCCFCCSEYDFFYDEFDRNNNKSKKRKKNGNRPKFVARQRECRVLNRVQLELPKTNQLLVDTWSGPVELCDSLRNLCLSPKVFKAYNAVSQHDQKILNRMAKKRNQKAMMRENALRAQKYWEYEKLEREAMKSEQNESFKQVIERKQEIDRRARTCRIEGITKRDLGQLNRIREDILSKELRLQQRLDNINLDKEIRSCERRQNETRKIEEVLEVQTEKFLEDQIRKQQIIDQLENRISRADLIRKHNMASYKSRLKIQNQMQNLLHAENYRDARNFEKYKIEALKQQIYHKDEKAQRFSKNRQHQFNEIIERARLSSSLRDLVRKSISPNGFQYNRGHIISGDRPISDLSLQSYIKLG